MPNYLLINFKTYLTQVKSLYLFKRQFNESLRTKIGVR